MKFKNKMPNQKLWSFNKSKKDYNKLLCKCNINKWRFQKNIL